MRPVQERKLRIVYTQKHAPYNSGEARTTRESLARRLCILGVAIPSAKRDESDGAGGWEMNAREKIEREKIATGSFPAQKPKGVPQVFTRRRRSRKT